MTVYLLAILIAAASICTAAESICLKTGFCVQAASHTQDGPTLQVRVGSGNITFPAADVAHIDFYPDAAVTPVAFPAPTSPTTSMSSSLDSQRLLSEAAKQEGLDADFVRSVAKIESNFRQSALSGKGAIGLMQLTGPTALDLGVNPLLASENVTGGAKYLRALLLKYHNNSALALAAYNAGPGAVARFGGVPPYEETRKYIVRVTREYDRRRLASSKPGERDAEEWLSKPLSSSSR